MTSTGTVVIGAGQAGLAVSYELKLRGVEHVVLERARVAQTWRERWESFCLVTPNWTVQLPGGAYAGPEPDGFMSRDEVVTHLEDYARGSGAPVKEGVEVERVERVSEGGFTLSTSSGEIRAATAVVATGTYRKPHRPFSESVFPSELFMLDAEGYSSPAELPPGDVLVIGSGQTGCQLAEELREDGREVVLACGRAGWLPRRIGGRDFVRWLAEAGFLDAGVQTLPAPSARLLANVLATGHGGGHDLHYRTLHAMGVVLTGHLTRVEDGTAYFARDLKDSVAWSDRWYSDRCEMIRGHCQQLGISPPELRPPEPFDVEGCDRVELSRFAAVIFTSGFRPDFASWIEPQDAFDELGFPYQLDGASTVVPGLYFAGVHFMRTRKSSLLFGVGEDAAIVADLIALRSGLA